VSAIVKPAFRRWWEKHCTEPLHAMSAYALAEMAFRAGYLAAKRRASVKP